MRDREENAQGCHAATGCVWKLQVASDAPSRGDAGLPLMSSSPPRGGDAGPLEAGSILKGPFVSDVPVILAGI